MSVPSPDHLLHSFDAALTEEISRLQAHAGTLSSVATSTAPHTSHRNPTIENLALAAQEDNPDPVDDAQPLVSSVHLLLRLRERLQVIARNPNNWSTTLALKAFSSSGQPKTILSIPRIPPQNVSLDASQSEAYCRALENDFTFIWGPPGTGKTRVIGQILHAALEDELRVLLCSTTNSAVDHALDGVFEDRDDSVTEKILRVGTPSQDASPHVHAVTLAQRLESEATPLRAEMQEIKEALPVLQETITTLQEQAQELRHRTQQRKHLSAIRKDHSRTTRALDAIQHQIQLLTVRRTQLRKKLQVSPSWTDRVLWWRRPRLQAEFDTKNQAFHTLLGEAGTLLETFSQLEDKVANAQIREDEPSSQAEYACQGRSTWEIEEELHRAEAQLDHAYTRLEELRGTLQQLERDFVKEAQLIATTLTRASCFHVLESERFEMIIVDEASLASLPALFAALCLITRHVILVGDFLQLPPIAQNTSSKASEWLTQSIYDVTHIQNHHDPRVAALTTQYRMHPDIGNLAGTLYRQRGLPFCSAPCLSDDRQPVVSLPPFPHSAVAVVDTAQACPQVARDERNSPVNLYHALVVVRLVKQTLLNRDTAKAPITIAVMSPYRAQVKAIQRLLRHQGLDGIHVGTIHQCQGQQFDVVIFDTTIINNLRQSFLCQPESSTGGTTLLNVAMTRAKAKLILIGHARALGSLPPKTFLRTCFDYTSLKGITIESTQFVEPLTHPPPVRWWTDEAYLPVLLDPLCGTHRPTLTAV